MSEKVIVSKEKLTAIAENIRTQTKTTELVTLDEMATMKLGTDTSNATATSDDILLGKTAYANDTELVGTIETYDGSSENGEVIVRSLKKLLDVTQSCASMFYGKTTLTSVSDLIAFKDTENVTDMSNMFFACSALTTIPQLDTSNVTTIGAMFAGCSKLTTIPQLDTSKATNMYGVFQNCSALTTIPQLDTSKATNMNDMFRGCSKLTTILCYGMALAFSVSSSTLLEEQAIVTIGSNCQVVSSTKTLSIGSLLLTKVENTYVKKTGVELYEGITCEPCVICESIDEGAMLFTDYMSEKGWTIA